MVHKFEERKGESQPSDEFRTEYEKDKGRIIHSEAFRRLQAKTQVLQASESDFHRNRLTHSVEVAQIGKGISRYLDHKYKTKLEQCGIKIDYDLIESICLAHDIGHPPFGHGGEIALNYMMRDYGGFEGNGQTLRILSKLGKYSSGFGMNLTRRTMLGVLKYPNSYKLLHNGLISRNQVDKFYELNQDEWMPPKCFYDEENEIVDWILSEFSEEDQTLFKDFISKAKEHHKTKYKSFDCSIMDLADDISYCVHDFEDGYELGAFSSEQLNNFKKYAFENERFNFYLTNEKNYNTRQVQELKSLSDIKHFISVSVGFFIRCIEIEKRQASFSSPYLLYIASLPSEAKSMLKLFEDMVWESIILTPPSQQLVKNGQVIICDLFDVLVKNTKLLPKRTQGKLDGATCSERVVCDYVSGMTDRYALKMYKKIFGSDTVSYFEK